MKQVYLLMLSFMPLFAGCNSDQANMPTTAPQSKDHSIYEQISAKYEQKQQALPTPKTAGFWGWLKRVASADAKAVAAYVVKHGTKSDWKEALVIGAAASASEAIGSGTSKKGIRAASETTSYHHLIVSDIQGIKTAEFKLNTMDFLGYYHYILVNEVLRDTTLSTIPSSELSAVLYDKIHQQAKKIGIDATYDKEMAVAFLAKLNSDHPAKSDADYTQHYAFEKNEDREHFIPIAKQYTTTFFHLHDTALFIAYSKEMETAVLQDTTLSQHVKDVLLLAMATYRFGNTYYFSNF
ncbi:hypothetical protein [Myroides sp. DW712]|uniref:hypothetical protein n=1 Tax=Myroides sp. DW712 TaxID=3389800 RepID=UPI00397DAE36